MNQNSQLHDSYLMKSSGIIDIYPGEQAVTHINLELAPDPPFPLSGTVLDRFSEGRGIAGATVCVFTEANELLAKTDTDEIGRFSFDSLPCGTCRLTACKEGYQAAQFQSLVLEPEQAVFQKLVLPPLDSSENLIYGRVTDAGQNALSGVRVSILREDGATAASTTTAPDGTFAVYGLPDGAYTVLFGAQGYGSRSFAAAIGAQSRLCPVDAVLPPGSAPDQSSAVSGFVTSQQGAPLAYAWVGLYAVSPQGGESLYAAVSATVDGFYYFGSVPAGTYRIKSKVMVM